MGAIAPDKDTYMKKHILLFCLALAFGVAHAQSQQYWVVGITDGDTVRVLNAAHQLTKCRLYGIDAPEKAQPFGEKSKQSLSDMIFHKMIDIEITDQDQYGRSICRIALNGVDVNLVQVRRGLAWHYKRYSHDAAYAEAEISAR
jgi:micrococcal nuclease